MSPAFLRRAAAYAALIAAPVFAVVAWASWTGVPAGRALTMNFMVLAFAQTFHLGNARDDRPVLRPARALANRVALVAVAAVIVLQTLTVSIQPLAALLQVHPLTAFEWGVVFSAAAIPAVAGQTIKVVRARRGGRS